MYVVVGTGTRKSNKDFKGAIQMEQLLFILATIKPLLSPFQAPYKHLPSNKSLRKNNTKQKQLQEQKARENKTVVVVVKKILNSNAKTKPSVLFIY
ncbi:TPA: hypothetical protein ACGN81_004230 [Bacillus cereus]|nr:hypothetical protein [Bacillus cereus]